MQDPTPGSDFDLPTIAGVGGDAAARTAVSDSNASDAATIADAGALPAGTPAKTPSKTLSSTTFFVPGKLLGARYQILKILWEGGMGAVYQARDQGLDSIIAMEVILAEPPGGPGILQRCK